MVLTDISPNLYKPYRQTFTPTFKPDSPRTSRRRTAGHTTDSIPTRKPQQRKRFYSDEGAKRQSTRKSSTPSSRANSSSWWRKADIDHDDLAELRSRLAFACSDNLSPEHPSKNTTSTSSQSFSPGVTKKKFILVPKALTTALTTEIISGDLQTITKPTHRTSEDLQTTSEGFTKPVRDTQGWLKSTCVKLFSRAYGLNGYHKEPLEKLFKQATQANSCSRRAFLEVLLGYSYQDLLSDLRQQVPNYPEKPKKTEREDREAILEKLALKMFKPRQNQKAVQIQQIEQKAAHLDRGMLEKNCVDLFSRAYGLNGKAPEDHRTLYLEAVQKFQCSRRAFLECCYGHSYQALLGQLREQVPNYPVKKTYTRKQKEEREAQLEKLHIIMNPLYKEGSPQLKASAQEFSPTNP